MDVRAACCGDRDRSCGSGSSPDSFPPFAVSKEFTSSGNASRNESRPGNVPVCRLYLADWDGGVRGGETSAVSRCEAICALSGRFVLSIDAVDMMEDLDHASFSI